MSRSRMLETLSARNGGDPLSAEVAALERQAAALVAEPSRLALWRIVSAAAGAANALQAHIVDCTAPAGPLAEAGRSDPARAELVEHLWAEHATIRRHLNVLIGLANAVLYPGPGEVSEIEARAQDVARRLTDHHDAARELVYGYAVESQ